MEPHSLWKGNIGLLGNASIQKKIKVYASLEGSQNLTWNTLKFRKNSAIALLKTFFLSFESVDWERTKAYSLGNYGQIYVNLKGREPKGVVSPGLEYEKVLNDITERLYALQDPKTGKTISGKVYRKEDIYHGPFLDEAPDLVFMPDDLRVNGFVLYQFSSNNWLEHTFDRSGGHRMDGILMMWGPGIRKGVSISDSHITDLTPTILAARGLPIPDDVDGKVLTSAFQEEFFEMRPIKYTKASPPPTRERLEFSQEEEEDIKERLRELGYMA